MKRNGASPPASPPAQAASSSSTHASSTSASLLEHVTCPTEHVPHMAWDVVVHQTPLATVAKLHCFGRPCRRHQAAVQVKRADEGGDRCQQSHALLAKLFHNIHQHRLHVHTTRRRDAAHKAPAGHMHWVTLDDSNTILCDAFTLEVLISYLLCNTHVRPRPCWSFHVPCLLYHFVHPSRRLGGMVMTHEGTTLRTWKATASPLQLLVVLFQVAASLHTLQRHLHFKHNDLHDDNVVIVQSPVPVGAPPCVRYVIDDVEYFVPNLGITARIIDFQFATLRLPSGQRVVRADAFLRFQSSQRACVAADKAPRRLAAPCATTSAQWWRPSLFQEWGYDLQVLLSSLLLTLAHNPRRKEHQRVVARALHAMGIQGSPQKLRAVLAQRPSVHDTSDVKPRMFLLRVFGGRGSYAMCDFRTAPTATNVGAAIPTRMVCGHLT